MTDSIQVISWNILNPDPDFVKMSLRLVVNQKKTKNNRSESVFERSRKLAVINEKRYQSQRKPRHHLGQFDRNEHYEVSRRHWYGGWQSRARGGTQKDGAQDRT